MPADPASAQPASARALLGGLALALIVVGQSGVSLAPAFRWPGWVLTGLGLALFLWSRLRPPPRWLASRWPATLSTQALWVPAAVVLTGLATALSVGFQRVNQTNFLPVLLLWFGAGAAYLAAFFPPLRRPDLRAWWAVYGREALRVGLVMLAGGALRFYALGLLPRVINGDEGVLGQAALNTVQLPLANPFALFENFGSLYLQVIETFLQLFGQNALGLRLAPALGGTLAVGAVYLLARWLFGPRVALLAAALLAASHAHLHFSRTVAVGYIQGTLLIPLELYLFMSGLEKRSAARLALAGLVLGLHFCIYLSAQIIAGYLLVYLLVAAVVCRPLIQRAWRAVLAFAGGLSVAALPELAYAWFSPEQFWARLNIDGTFQSGWLAEQAVATGRSPALILVERVVHAFLSLTFYPAVDFYGAAIPLLDVLTSVLFFVGLVYAFSRWREPRYLMLNGFFWAVTVSVGVFAVPPSADSYRMLIALPGALILAALGLDQAFTVLNLAEASQRWPRLALAGALVGAIGLTNTRAYFHDFVAQCRYGGDPQTRFASYLGRYLATVDREADVFLLSTDVFRHGTHSSVDFLSDNHPITNVPEPADSVVAAPNQVLIASAPRADELSAWARANPGGELQRQYDCENLMLVAYELPER